MITIILVKMIMIKIITSYSKLRFGTILLFLICLIKEVFAKNERGYRLTSIRLGIDRALLNLLLSRASKMRKWFAKRFVYQQAC